MLIPRIQILMPVYNAELYLEEALQSIVEQTFSEWELLAIDDGSSDRSYSILAQFAQGDARIKVRKQENIGVIKTLHRLVDWSTAPVLARMDADDVCDKFRLEKQLKHLGKNKSMLVGCWAKLFGTKHDTWHYRETDNDIRMLAFFGRCPMLHASLVGSRDVFIKHALRETYVHTEDLDFLLRVALDESIALYNVQDALYFYRQHQDSVIYQHEKHRIDVYRQRFSDFLRSAGVVLDGESLECYLTFVYTPHLLSNWPSEKTLKVLKTVALCVSRKYPSYVNELTRRLEALPEDNDWLIEQISSTKVL